MKLYLVRHGQTEYNLKRAYYGRLDAGLTKEGLAQAEAYSQFFRGTCFEMIISSPLSRATQTADIIKKPDDGTIVLEPRLMEQDMGLFEGKTYEELLKESPKELKEWNDDWIYSAPPGGESFVQVYERTKDFCNDLRSMEHESVLIIAHMGTLRHICSILLDMKMTDFWCFEFLQGCYSRLDIEDGYTIVRRINESVIKGEEDGFI